jgi:Rieske 2Fe-2S family protein
MTRHPLSPRLDHCPESLPREAYVDPQWFAREMETVFAWQWLCVGRLADFPKGQLMSAAIAERSSARRTGRWGN